MKKGICVVGAGYWEKIILKHYQLDSLKGVVGSINRSEFSI